MPGRPGVTFGLVISPDLNDLGQMAFLSRLSGGGLTPLTDAAIFRASGSGLEIVVQEGDPTPGLDGAVLFNFRQPMINDLFFAINDTGLWAEDPAGELSLVAAVGQGIEIAPGDVRVVDRLFANGTWSFGFNDASQTLFAANFSDGSSGRDRGDIRSRAASGHDAGSRRPGACSATPANCEE